MELKPGYKQTEAGVIPEDWKLDSIAKLVSITTGARNTQDRVEDGLYPFFVRSSTVERINSFSFDGEAVLTAGDGVGTGKIYHYIKGKFDYHQRVYCMHSFNEELDGYYFYLYFGNHFFSRVMSMTAKSSVDSVRREMIADMKMPLPPLSEQRAIAAALSDTDALLSSLVRLLTKKRDIKQAVMQQLLTGKHRLPRFGEKWESRTIEQLEKLGIVKLSRGQVISKKDIESIPGSLPIYSSSVKNDGLFGRYGRFMFDEEMITWSVDGGGHFFYRAKHKFSVTNVCGFMRVDTTKLDYRFLAAQLQLLHSKLTFDYQDKAHPSVIRKAYTVSVPPLGEQTAIAAVLSDMDAEIDALTQRRDKTRALKQGMMHELLTGRTRLVLKTREPQGTLAREE